MDWTLIFTAIGTIATIVSTIISIHAKNESKKILNQIKEEKNHHIESSSSKTINNGFNSGIINGINSGDIG